MSRECSGCGLRSCEGQCFDECDPDAVEAWENIKRLSEQYRLTEVHGDPLLRRRA
jgi:hypothetical protein